MWLVEETYAVIERNKKKKALCIVYYDSVVYKISSVKWH